MIYYICDENQNLVGFQYHDITYYYLKNAQEDIIGILDSNYHVVANYQYDAWGRIISITDSNGVEITDTEHIAYINPFRYRSYYYDSETGYYYLNSRYYDPNWGRFLNADGTIGANDDTISHNLFAYVSNNPINHFDSTGYFFKKIFNAVKKAAKKIINKVLTTISNVVGKIKKADLAADLFNKSLDDYNTPLNKNIQNKIKTKTQNTVQIQSAVSKCIQKNNGNDFKNCTGSDTFKNGDPYLSIGKFNYDVSGTKLLDQSWNIKVTLTDLYNFDGSRKIKDFGSAANNVGYMLNKAGIVHEYYWNVTYSFNYEE